MRVFAATGTGLLEEARGQIDHVGLRSINKFRNVLIFSFMALKSSSGIVEGERRVLRGLAKSSPQNSSGCVGIYTACVLDIFCSRFDWIR